MSDKVPTAKVYVWKDPQMGEEGKPWKVGLMGWGDVLVIVQDCLTHDEAWAWLYDNYVRETPAVDDAPLTEPEEEPEPYDGYMWGDND